MKSIQLHDSVEGLSQKIVSITLHYVNTFQTTFKLNNLLLKQSDAIYNTAAPVSNWRNNKVSIHIKSAQLHSAPGQILYSAGPDIMQSDQNGPDFIHNRNSTWTYPILCNKVRMKNNISLTSSAFHPFFYFKNYISARSLLATRCSP